MKNLGIRDCAEMMVEERRQAYTLLACDPSFLSQIIDHLGGSPKHHEVATWFLKYHLEQGEALSQAKAAQIYRLANNLEHWASLLHILQAMPNLPIPAQLVDEVEVFLRRCLQHQNKFVRAWAYNGFACLARSYPQYENEATSLLKSAVDSEAPSVKARIRSILRGDN